MSDDSNADLSRDRAASRSAGTGQASADQGPSLPVSSAFEAALASCPSGSQRWTDGAMEAGFTTLAYATPAPVSLAGQDCHNGLGAAPLARLMHERSALDNFEVLAGGLIFVEMAEGDSNLQRLERGHDFLGLRDALLVVLRCLQLGGDSGG